MKVNLETADEKKPILRILPNEGKGRTYAVEVLDAMPEGYDENLHTWQEVESGDLDGWYENGAMDEDIPENETEEDFVRRVHPPCEGCGEPIYVNSGDWMDPWGDYRCSDCVTFVD